MKAIKPYKKLLGSVLATCCCVIFMQQYASAQLYTVKNGKMYIEVDKKISDADLDSFIVRYDLFDLSLKFFIKTSIQDTLKMRGWKVEKNNDRAFAISKPLISSDDLTNLADKIMFTEKDASFSMLFPAVNNGQFFGSNRFKNKNNFAGQDSIVTFFLRNYKNKNRVFLAGSFNNWKSDTLPMTKTDSGWVADVKLGPGKYWYKFIADGNWMTDEDNLLKENDGKGNINSVFFKSNYLFKLDGYPDAKKVYLAGSFNNWQPRDLLMQKTTTGWQLPVYLADGTHTYRFIVDGTWIADPGNPNWYPNEFNDYNSVVRIGKAYNFVLKGYSDAGKVLVTGSFNRWMKDELYMQKTDTGWVLPYTLGPGNYEYRFIVDGKEIIDPANPLNTNTENLREANSILILDPNHTFRLKGYPDAKKVILAGDFNNYNPHAYVMHRAGDEWIFSVHLTLGKHIYKFVVDNEWIRDPANPLWEQNRFGTGDSVIWFGE